MEHPVADVS
jgi:hypothetical protein